jgi:hypothetical protein
MTHENLPFSVELPLSDAQFHIEPDSDWLLKQITQYINRTLFSEIPITIFVKGIVISGILIPDVEYIDIVSHECVGASEELVDIFWSSRDDSIRDDYIHLKNATFNSDVTPMTINSKVYWRGRLSSIDGFVVGKLVIRE